MRSEEGEQIKKGELMSKIQIFEDSKVVFERVVSTEKAVFALNGTVVWEKQYSIPGPVDPPVPPPPTTPGQWTSIIAKAKKCNTELVGGIGGYGYYDRNTPGPASVAGHSKTYFLFDPAWLPGKWKTSGKRLTLMWIDFTLTPGVPKTLIELDALDNGKILGTNGATQASFNVTYKPATRWLIEFDTTNTDGFSVSIKWP
jgi:hypothetical protein